MKNFSLPAAMNMMSTIARILNTPAIARLEKGSFQRAFNVLLIPLICFIIAVKIWDALSLHWLIIAAALIYLAKDMVTGSYKMKLQHITLIDISVVITVLLEIVSFLLSTYKANSLHHLTEAFFMFLFYLMMRFNFREDYQRLIIYVFITLLGFCLSVAAIFIFALQYDKVISLGFTDVTSLKSLFYLLGPSNSPTGEWITIFLTLLPFPLILFIRFNSLGPARWLLLCPFIAILAAMLISFSRGGYLAVLAFFVSAIALFYSYKVFSIRKIILLNLAVVVPLMISAVPIMKPVFTTVYGFETNSQIRSYEGRKDLWKHSSDIMKDYPLLGVGANNFAMKYVSYKNQAEESVFAGRSFNIFLQLSIEKGILGLLAYCLLFFSFYWVSHKNIKLLQGNVFHQSVAILFMCAFTAVLVRDLSYSSILTNKGVSVMLWFMFAANAEIQPEGGPGKKASSFSQYVVLGPVLAAVVLLACANFKYQNLQSAENSFRQFVKELQHEQYTQARPYIEEAVRLSPDSAYYLSHEGLIYERMIQNKFDAESFLEGRLKFDQQGQKQITEVISRYRKAVDLNPEDDCFYHNLGWLYCFLGQQDQALSHFQKAIEIDNNISLYHLSLGIMRERLGEREKAYSEYALALRISPSILDSKFFLDFLKRSPSEAFKVVARTAKDLESETQQHGSPVLEGKLGKIYLYLGRTAEATEVLSRALSKLPNLSRAWSNLGMIYELAGQESLMKECLEKSILLDPADYLSSFHLAEFHYRNSRIEDALSYYRQALEGRLNQSSLHAQRASRIYHSRYTAPDDVVPNGLLAYCSPFLDAGAIASKLAMLYSQKGDKQLMERYLDISVRFRAG